MRDKDSDELVQTLSVLIVKPADARTIEVQHTDQSFTISVWVRPMTASVAPAGPASGPAPPRT